MLILLLALALQQPDTAPDAPLTLDDSIDAAAAQEQTGETPAAEPPAPTEGDSATPVEGSAGPAAATEGDTAAVAEALEKGFRACALQVTSRAHISRARADDLKKEGISLGDVPPDEVATFSKTQFPEDRLFAKIDSKAGALWMIASPTLPLCKVTVSDTPSAVAAREAVDARMDANKDWSADAARSKSGDGVTRKAWTQAAGAAGSRVLLQIDGPDAPANNGDGIQAILTVALVTAKAE